MRTGGRPPPSAPRPPDRGCRRPARAPAARPARSARSASRHRRPGPRHAAARGDDVVHAHRQVLPRFRHGGQRRRDAGSAGAGIPRSPCPSSCPPPGAAAGRARSADARPAPPPPRHCARHRATARSPAAAAPASAPVSRCSRAGHSAAATPRAIAASVSQAGFQARSAAMAMPAFSAWCGPGRPGGGRSIDAARIGVDAARPARASQRQSRPRISSGAPASRGDALDHRRAPRALQPGGAGHAGLDDAGLLAGDGAQRVAEEIHVVHRDDVIAVATGRSTTLVASSRPPSPTSSTIRSAGTRQNSSSARRW